MLSPMYPIGTTGHVIGVTQKMPGQVAGYGFLSSQPVLLVLLRFGCVAFHNDPRVLNGKEYISSLVVHPEKFEPDDLQVTGLAAAAFPGSTSYHKEKDR